MSSDRRVELIRQDGIDVLVDLAMHTNDKQLLLFARKPAPVQATYLAYPGFTGLETIDYRLTDPYLDPPATEPNTPAAETPGAEQPLRLPHCFWCYAPQPEAGDVEPLPVLSTGRITFGCLNAFSKVSPPVSAAWIHLLHEVPGSQLLIHAHAGRHRQGFRERMESEGLNPARIDFVGFLKSAEYFRQYHRIDVALDTFPYAGGTTTCDTLWMGVPVVGIAGSTPISRGGLSILSNVGLQDLVARDFDEYITIATRLASDVKSLNTLRLGMRQRMLSSPLMDAVAFARDVEAAFRQMWRTWCEKQRGISSNRATDQNVPGVEL
jgi:predicted O-linked N-acetylglucosamine transferase (SPINDLY family)